MTERAPKERSVRVPRNIRPPATTAAPRPEAAELTSLDALVPDSHNANAGTERGQGLLEDSLRQYGAGRSIVVDRQGRIIGGNKTVLVAQEMGLPIEVVQTDGSKLVVVQRTDLDLETDEAARMLAWSDNRSAEINLSWDAAVLAADIEAGVDLSKLFREDEIAAILANLDEVGPGDGGTVGDAGATPAVPDEAVSVPGDVWLCGKGHRVACGDSTVTTDIDRLMGQDVADLIFTDPPYGVAYVGKTRDALTIKNDNLGDEGTRGLVRDALTIAPLKPGGAFYVCCASLTQTAFEAALGDAHLQLRQVIIWVKNHFTLGRFDYHWRHEPILYGWKDGAAHYFIDDRTLDTVWEIDRPTQNAEHPTMKPVPLVMKALECSSREGETVLDLFGGSGTTMIACESMKRVARIMEKDPKYVDVIVQRYADFTGTDPVREADGASWRKLNAGRRPAQAAPVEDDPESDEEAG